MIRVHDTEAYERLGYAIVWSGIKESLKNYRKGKDNSKEEDFFRNNIIFHYTCPNIDPEWLISHLKRLAKEGAKE